jgi:hypothetical protein
MNKKAADLMFPLLGFVLLIGLFTVIIVVTFIPKITPVCTFPVEVDCVSYEMNNKTSGSIVLYVKNNFHENATLKSAEIVDSKCSYSFAGSENGSSLWMQDDIVKVTFDCKEIKKTDNTVIVNLNVQSDNDYLPQRYTGHLTSYLP